MFVGLKHPVVSLCRSQYLPILRQVLTSIMEIKAKFIYIKDDVTLTAPSTFMLYSLCIVYRLTRQKYWHLKPYTNTVFNFLPNMLCKILVSPLWHPVQRFLVFFTDLDGAVVDHFGWLRRRTSLVCICGICHL